MKTYRPALIMGKYWDIDKTLSHGCLFNFIYGPRGSGKTYTSQKKMVKGYLKSKGCEQFLWVRRYKEELKKLTSQRNGRFFNAVSKEFPRYVLKAEANVLSVATKPPSEIDKPMWKTCGYAASLNTSLLQKSDSMPDVWWIVFDEFLIDTSSTSPYKYLNGEVETFLNLYETVARGRDVRVLFLGNALSAANPYFDYFRITPPKDSNYRKYGDILVENVQVPALMKERKESRFGQLVSGTEYSEYAYDNVWLLDSNEFIEQKNQRCVYYCSLKYDGEWYGIWEDPLLWKFYCSVDYNPEFPLKYAITGDDHEPNVLLIHGAKRLNLIANLIQAYDMGAMRYDNQRCKFQFREMMRTIGIGR